jgi:hypothetical protein
VQPPHAWEGLAALLHPHGAVHEQGSATGRRTISHARRSSLALYCTHHREHSALPPDWAYASSSTQPR